MAIKYLHDHYDAKFFLTGSSSFYLKNLFPESLAGRKVVSELMPLDFREFLVFKGREAPEGDRPRRTLHRLAGIHGRPRDHPRHRDLTPQRTNYLDFYVHYHILIMCAVNTHWSLAMRSTVTLDKKRLDELVYETKARSKVSAVNEAITEYLKRRKIERIMSMKGKLEFDMTAEEIRDNERR